MAKKTMTITYEKSSGNVFADLGLPRPEQALLKARLTLQIHRNIKARHLTQVQAGEILGIKQPHVSLLNSGGRPARTTSAAARRCCAICTSPAARGSMNVPRRRGMRSVW